MKEPAVPHLQTLLNTRLPNLDKTANPNKLKLKITTDKTNSDDQVTLSLFEIFENWALDFIC